MKNRVVSIRLSESEYQRVLFKSSAANKKISELFRESVNDTEIKFNNAKDFASKISTLNLIANNINQIAKELNMENRNDELSNVNYDDLMNCLITINNQLKEII